MADIKHLSITIEDGFDPDSNKELEKLSADLLGIDQGKSRAGFVAPLLLYSRNGLKDEVEALLADQSGVLLHETQTLEQLSTQLTNAGIRIDTNVQVEGGERPGIQADAKLFDAASDTELGSARTVLRKLPSSAVSQIIGTAVSPPSHEGLDGEVIGSPVTAQHLQTHADLYQDHNPIHLDRKRATGLGFADLVVPGLFILGLVPDALCQVLPDLKLEKMRARFLAPGYVDQQLHFRIKTRSNKEGQRLARVFVSSSDERLLAIIDTTLG